MRSLNRPCAVFVTQASFAACSRPCRMSTDPGICSTFPGVMTSNSSNSKQASGSGMEPAVGGVRILVVDDERLSAHNLGIQLKFVGESPLFATSENWLRALETNGGQENLLAV